MGILKDAIRQVLSESAKEQGIDIKFIDSPTRVIKTSAQSKYDDVRRVERNYTRGVHKARKEAGSDRTYSCGYAYADTPEQLKHKQLETLCDDLATKKTKTRKGGK
nr:MAG TPA: hypothetical protein [Caudoviricetes sp.]